MFIQAAGTARCEASFRRRAAKLRSERRWKSLGGSSSSARAEEERCKGRKLHRMLVTMREVEGPAGRPRPQRGGGENQVPSTRSISQKKREISSSMRATLYRKSPSLLKKIGGGGTVGPRTGPLTEKKKKKRMWRATALNSNEAME